MAKNKDDDNTQVPNMLCAMLDLVWVEHSGTKQIPHFLLDYQVMELWREGYGFPAKGDPRMYLYTALMNGDMYYTEDKALWSAMQAHISGYKEAKLGYKCGCREIRLRMNPLGHHLSHSLPPGISGVLDMPMRCIAFDKKLQRGTSCEMLHRSIHPVLYASLKDKPEDSLRVWCPTKGWLNVVRMPVPVCLAPYNVSLAKYVNRATINKFIDIWMDMVSQWMRNNRGDTVFIGYDFENMASPRADKIDHLVTEEEYAMSPQPRPFLQVEYDHKDKLGALDITARNATIAALTAGRFDTGCKFLDL